jgi:GNAT superfamily N-acetyltransferase
MSLRFVLNPELTDDLQRQLRQLWLEVSNAGGAVGFVPPVTEHDVAPVAERAFAKIINGPDRLLVGYEQDRPVAMLIFSDNGFPLTAHWQMLKAVMVHPDRQGHGYGAALVREAERIARALGLTALHLTARDGLGLDTFYGRLGYREVGRLPGALRVGPGDDRDEVLMWLPLG